MDLETVYCKLLYNRGRSFVALIDAEPIHFLCSYTIHCFALCHCCDFDACDCEMTCPTNCTCFHDQSWSTNVVECSAGSYTNIPANIPMDTTELYIDGNELNELSGHSFIGRKNLKVLFANASNIQIIYNTTFHGLRKLIQLHLENNRILRFMGNEFSALENLRELYLQNNRISYIDNHTFLELRKLEVLRLDHNHLVHFEVWQLLFNSYLVEIGLANNSWSCECSYLGRFRGYWQTNYDKIVDAGRIACVYNNMTSVLKDKNGSKCTLKEGIASIVQAQDIETMLPLLLAASCAFVGFFGLIIGVFCYRHELKSWAHTNCLMDALLCYKSSSTFHNADEFDKNRLYDAYISYSLQDEHFVNQILSNTLENNVGYRLLLHYRDLNINTYVPDTIVEAVESSKRTMLILSRNFLYNEWSRFEFKSAIHEIVKRRTKLIFILYGDLPQRDIDADMRMYLRTSTCIEWDDKNFWQKLRMALPHLSSRRARSGGVGGGGGAGGVVDGGGGGGSVNHCFAKRSTVNIYATASQPYGTAVGPRTIDSNLLAPGGSVSIVGAAGNECAINGRLLDCNNYATINDCGGRNCDKFEPIICKYSATNEHTNMSSKSIEMQLQHEYAVPANCLKGSFQHCNTTSCERISDDGTVETFECTATSKFHGDSVTPSICSSNSGGGGGGVGAITGVVGGGLAPNVCYSFNSSNCNNSNNSMCAAVADECCNRNMNCTLGECKCSIVDRRMQPNIWA